MYKIHLFTLSLFHPWIYKMSQIYTEGFVCEKIREMIV